LVEGGLNETFWPMPRYEGLETSQETPVRPFELEVKVVERPPILMLAISMFGQKSVPDEKRMHFPDWYRKHFLDWRIIDPPWAGARVERRTPPSYGRCWLDAYGFMYIVTFEMLFVVVGGENVTVEFDVRLKELAEVTAEIKKFPLKFVIFAELA
jgi:hypothetical protein